MSPLDIDGILLDIEGTTSSVSFVYEVLFPFARDHVRTFLAEHWDSDDLRAALEHVAHDAGHPDAATWLGGSAWSENGAEAAQSMVLGELLGQMERDAKATGLKQVQGLIWRRGFESGELRSHVYPDVPGGLRAWNALGLDVRIYSSGSVSAQKLFFAHTIAGDLSGSFRGHYDTTTGPKRDAASYRTIAAAFGRPADRLLFISDIPEELAAADEAGWQTALSVRPGNAPVQAPDRWSTITSFDQVVIADHIRGESRR